MAQTSAQPCGCDPGANWICQVHRATLERAEAIPDDVAIDRSRLKDPRAHDFVASMALDACYMCGQPKGEHMGYSARANETARKAASGELMSRRTIIGAMDHALEVHASALRLLEAKIVALSERIEELELAVAALLREAEQSAIGRVEKLYRPPVELPPPPAKLLARCTICGATGPSGFHHVHDFDTGNSAYWVAPTEQP